MNRRDLLAAVLALAALAAPPALFARDCIEYADYLHWVGGVDLPGEPRRVTRSGDLVYVSLGPGHLSVVDVSAPAAPQAVGWLSTNDDVYDAAVRDTLGLVAENSEGVRVVTFADPARPGTLGTLDLTGQTQAVAFVGDRAYVCAAELEVVDISDPRAPGPVTTLDLPWVPNEITVAGNLALVATDPSGLIVVDVSSPDFAIIRGGIPLPGGRATGVAVAGAVAWVTAYPAGLLAIDISLPQTPALIGELPLEDGAFDVAVDGDRAFVACGYAGVSVADITDPAHPALVGRADTAEIAFGVAASATHAFIAESEFGLTVVDLENRRSPGILGQEPLLDAAVAIDLSAPGSGLALAGVAAHGLGLVVLDVTDPAAPVPLGSFETLGWATGVALFDLASMPSGLAAVLDEFAGLVLLDLENPAAPEALGTWPTPLPRAVAVHDTVAFVCDPTLGLRLVDVDPPTAPVEMATVPLPAPAYPLDVAADGAFAYVAAGLGGLLIVDRTVTPPVIVGGVTLPAEAQSIAIRPPRVYVTTGFRGLQVISVADPAAPIVIGAADTPGFAAQVTLSANGGTAYVGDASAGLYVFDLGAGPTPVLLGAIDTPGEAHGIKATAGALFIAGAEEGLVVAPVECEIPGPVEIAEFTATAEAGAIHLGWEVLSAEDLLGFHVHRARGEAGPEERLTAEPIVPPAPTAYRDAAVDPGLRYRYRLEIVELSGASHFVGPVTATALAPVPAPARFYLAAGRPNPFDPGAGAPVVIAFELAWPARATLRVLDIEGRLVRRLLDEPRAAGSHTATWDGRTEPGAPAPSGIYFYELRAGEFAASRKMSVVR